MGNVTLIPGTLPSAYCFQSWQKVYNDFFTLATGQLGNSGDTLNTFNYGDTTPAPENRNSPWLRTVAGAPDRWYVYYGGAWVWPNPESPSTDVRRLWVGTVLSLKTYDGGVDEPVGVDGMTGPMWEEDTSFQGRSPMHPGNIPGTNPVVSIAVGNNYGEGQHTQTIAEMPKHNHTITGEISTNNFWSGDGGNGTGVGQGDSRNFGTWLILGDTGADTAFNITHPVRGIYLIKRTSRIFYKV